MFRKSVHIFIFWGIVWGLGYVPGISWNLDRIWSWVVWANNQGVNMVTMQLLGHNGSIRTTWICERLFKCGWKKWTNIFSHVVVKNGDESHSRIRKGSTTKQIQVGKGSPRKSFHQITNFFLRIMGSQVTGTLEIHPRTLHFTKLGNNFTKLWPVSWPCHFTQTWRSSSSLKNTNRIIPSSVSILGQILPTNLKLYIFLGGGWKQKHPNWCLSWWLSFKLILL